MVVCVVDEFIHIFGDEPLNKSGVSLTSDNRGVDISTQVLIIVGFILIIVIVQNSASFSVGIHPVSDGSIIPSDNNTLASYTVYIDGETYYTKTGDGFIVAQGREFGQMMNDLNKILIPGDIIFIKSGVYTLSSRYWNQDKDNITIRGESRDNVIIRSSSTLHETPFMIADPNGGMHPANCVVEGITFDSNYNPYYFEFVLFGGQYNVIQNCNFLNALQYSLVAYRAHDFKILNNYVSTAQYGISTSAKNNQEWSTNGLISGNTVKDCRDCGLKIKWTKNTVIENNTVDVTYLTWSINGEDNAYDNCVGISLYHSDGPTQDITVANNTIYDNSSKPGETAGIGIDEDDLINQGLPFSISSGAKIFGNMVVGCNYGVLDQLPNVLIEHNVISYIKQGSIIGGIGIDLRDASYTQVRNNTLIETGISVGGSKGCLVEGNKISGGMDYWRIEGDGIAVWNYDAITHSDVCLLMGNLITNCRAYGIHIYTAPDVGNPVYGTEIINNTILNSVKEAIYDEGMNTKIN